MIKDVKSYFQTVASRLSNVFAVEDFDTEQELEFWSLAAEHVSRDENPTFRNIVHWIDLLFKAPVHFIYVKDKEEKLRLFRIQVMNENLQYILGQSESTEDQKLKKQLLDEFEDRIQNFETKISYDNSFKNPGVSSFTIGQCQHIPLFKEGKFWGIYCIGPYVKTPEAIEPRISIVGRILSGWLIELHERETNPRHNFKEQFDTDYGEFSTGRLNVEGISGLLLNYALQKVGAKSGLIVEKNKENLELITHQNVPESLLQYIESERSLIGKQNFESLFEEAEELLETEQLRSKALAIKKDGSFPAVYVFFDERDFEDIDTESLRLTIRDTLNGLLNFRDHNIEFSEDLLSMYYTMLRRAEQKKEKTKHHTPRVEAFCDKYGKLFGLDEHEQYILAQTARLHDIGYIGIAQMSTKRNFAVEIEHSIVGELMVKGLAIHEDIKRGIATHHEWVDGSGTPYGLKEEEIPWNGKIVGMFEHVVQFIESHVTDSSRNEDEWLEKLSEEFINRADKQFDLVMVPTAIELISSLGWKECCKLGTEE